MHWWFDISILQSYFSQKSTLNKKLSILDYYKLDFTQNLKFDAKQTKISYYSPLKSVLINDRDRLYTFDIDKKKFNTLINCKYYYDIYDNEVYILNNEKDNEIQIMDLDSLDGLYNAVHFKFQIQSIKSINKNEVLIILDNSIAVHNTKYLNLRRRYDVSFEGKINSIIKINKKLIGIVYENKVVAFNLDKELVTTFSWTL